VRFKSLHWRQFSRDLIEERGRANGAHAIRLAQSPNQVLRFADSEGMARAFGELPFGLGHIPGRSPVQAFYGLGTNLAWRWKMETWVPVSLIIATFAVLCFFSWLFIGSNRITDPKIFVVFVMADLFVMATICTFSIIILWGMKKLDLDANFVKWLGAATVGEVAGMVTIAFKWLFK
jgi:hypothetical protein